MNKVLSACSALSLVILIALVYFVVEYSKCHTHSKLVHRANHELGIRLQRNNADIANYMRAQKKLEDKYLEPQEKYSVHEEDGRIILQEHPVIHSQEHSVIHESEIPETETETEQSYLVAAHPHSGGEHHPYVSGEEHGITSHPHHYSLRSLGL